MKIATRNLLAYFFRSLPYFKGKNRLGTALIPLMTNYDVEQDCLVTIEMQDSSIMRLSPSSLTMHNQ